MAEKPLTKLARLVGGAALLPGPIAHQALGSLLISGSSNIEVAGANIALAAASRQTNAAIQIAMRSMAPAVAVDALSKKAIRRLEQQQRRFEEEQLRLEGLSKEVISQQRDLSDRSEAAYSEEINNERKRVVDLKSKLEQQQSLHQGLSIQVLELRDQNERLEREMNALKNQLSDSAAVATNRVVEQPQPQPSSKSTEATPKTMPTTKTNGASSQTKQTTEKQSVHKKKTTATKKKRATTEKKAKPTSRRK